MKKKSKKTKKLSLLFTDQESAENQGFKNYLSYQTLRIFKFLQIFKSLI